MTVDWNKPLELMDGTPVVLADRNGRDWGGTNPDSDGHYWVKLPNGYQRCVGDDGVGDIRNRAEPAATPEIEVGNVSFSSVSEVATLRDQFAMAAISGVMTNDPEITDDGLANDCYRIADAMMQARK